MFVFQGSHSNVRVPRFTFQGLCPNVCVPRFAFQGSHSEAHVPRFGFQGSCSKVRIPRLIFQGLHSCIQNFALRSCFAFLNRNKFWVFFFGASTRWPAISATLLTLDLFTGQWAPPPSPLLLMKTIPLWAWAFHLLLLLSASFPPVKQLLFLQREADRKEQIKDGKKDGRKDGKKEWKKGGRKEEIRENSIY